MRGLVVQEAHDLGSALIDALRTAGALPEAELIDVLGRLGFTGVRMMERFDCFRGTSKEGTARRYGVMGVNVLARKP